MATFTIPATDLIPGVDHYSTGPGHTSPVKTVRPDPTGHTVTTDDGWFTHIATGATITIRRPGWHPCLDCHTPTAAIYGLCDPCLHQHAVASRQASGVPDRITDPVLLRRLDILSRVHPVSKAS